MLPLKLPQSADQGLRVLCLGAHPDDIEIGLGGTLLRLIGEVPRLSVHWVVFSGNAKRRKEARASAEQFLSKVPTKQVQVAAFRESFFPEQWAAIKLQFENIAHKFQPDVVFTHYRHDRHQDHRVLSDLVWNTFRNQLVLEYEIPKYDGDLSQPNFFVPLTESQAKEKVRLLLEGFSSQRSKHWFDQETFLGLMRLRGVECAAKYAEAFHCRKCVL